MSPPKGFYMFERSDVRYACYRKQKGIDAEKHQEIISEIDKIKLPTDKWEDFSTGWDVFVTPKEITRIVPETDFDYIHTTCTEFKVKTNMGLSNEEIYEQADKRQKNIFEIVMLNNIEDDFSGFGETWRVSVDQGSKRIEVKSLKTKLNKVPKPPPKPVASAVRNTIVDMTDAEPIEDQELIKKLKALLKMTDKE